MNKARPVPDGERHGRRRVGWSAVKLKKRSKSSCSYFPSVQRNQ
nr:MAG TPA: hypothetical protein [Caudoviricetes sp.]